LPVHTEGFIGERSEDVRPAPEPHSEHPGSPDSSIQRALRLARVDETAAPTASEKMAVAGIQLRDALAAALPASIFGAQQPRTDAAEIASCPGQGHVLVGPRPFTSPATAPLKCERYRIRFDGDADLP
jgi:hypothetical protein